MAKSRSTLNIIDQLEYANKQLARTDEIATNDFKSGIVVMIEHQLHACNRYKGYYELTDVKGTVTQPNYSRKYF